MFDAARQLEAFFFPEKQTSRKPRKNEAPPDHLQTA
jgi:hypothetical protein